MIRQKKYSQWFAHRIPIIGILCFVGLYLYASTLYPGGSQADLKTQGFDWVHNYWCNLMNENGMNEQPNPARPFAILAMIILCLSLLIFFIQFAQHMVSSKFWKNMITLFGILSMLCASLIFTDYHDLMTTLSSIFGLVVVIGIIREIYKSDLALFKITGVCCVLLLAVNNYIYYTDHLISALPLIQKITFALILSWIIGLNSAILKNPHPNRTAS